MSRLQDVLENREDNYILPFFWQHGEDAATLREYMNAIYNANIKAVCVESRPHPDFAGEKWWEDMDVILSEAQKLGMKVWILDDSHFPTGFANGAVKKAPKELHHKYMCYRTLEMAGPVQQVEFVLKQYMQPAPPPPWAPAPPKSEDSYEDDRLLKILTCPVLAGGELGEPIDLTDHVEEERVVFDLPEGYFKIYVIYITRNGNGRNDYINFLDKDSCRILIDAVYEPHYARYKKYFGNVIAGFFSDEPPIGNVPGYTPVGPIGAAGQDLPWSNAAMEKMTREYGSEDWKRKLPYLWGAARNKEEQAKVRNAYMQMVTKLVAECFSMQNGKWCQDHGVEYIGHMLEDCDMNMGMGASMGHFFRGLSGQHMAGIDNIGGQVTIHGQHVSRHDRPACKDEAGFYQYMLGKLGASHAAIDPKKKGRTMCENFGAYGWQSGPREQKYMMDHFLVRGVNRYVPHAFTPAPFPDPDCPPHFYAHGENPTYRAFGELMAYSNRVCHLIDGGRACPDVAVLYAAEGVWAGDGHSDIPICRYLGQSQVDFHILPADVFAEIEEYPTTLESAGLTVNGVTYRALVIPGCRYLDASVAAFTEKALEESFPVVFTDRKPVGITGAAEKENEQFEKLTASCAVVPVEEIGAYLKQFLTSLQVVAQPENTLLTTYHYQAEGQDEFLILNEMAGQVYEGTITVTADGVPVRYYPWENRIEGVIWEETEGGEKTVSVSIQPLELCVIVFVTQEQVQALTADKESVCAEGKKAKVMAAELKTLTVGRVDAKDYLEQLRAAGAGVHEKHAVVQTGEHWALQAPYKGMQKLYPEYSGYYLYETKAALEAGKNYELQIDAVYETAEAFINGRSLGMRLQAPYTFRIPAESVKEVNDIRIEVATLPERKVKAMGVGISAMSAERPLSPTGIVGRVKIYEVR